MSKIKFVLPIAAAFGTALMLSCTTTIDDPPVMPQVQCATGEWNATIKKCVLCPEGTTMNTAGQCEAQVMDDNGTVVCPNGTKLNDSGTACVREGTVINATTKYYCDYGNVDPLAEAEFKSGCFEIEKADQCDKYGKLVASCQQKDRRTDALKYCDFGPVNEYGGGCFLSLSDADCDTDWGVIANKCGTNIQWPNGTVCPTGEGKTILDECNSNGNPNGNPKSDKYCYYGKATECWQINGWDGDPIKTEADCESHSGMVVASCSNISISYCDYGQPIIKNDGTVDKGCFAIRTAKDRQDCQDGTIRTSCPTTYTCPTGTTKADWGFGQFACEISGNVTPTPTPPSPSTSLYCDFGYKHSTAIQVDDGGGCFKVQSESDCDSQYGKLVNSCNSSDRRTDLDYCDYGAWGTYVEAGVTKIKGGCWRINSSEDRAVCDLDWAKIVKKCLWLN